MQNFNKTWDDEMLLKDCGIVSFIQKESSKKSYPANSGFRHGSIKDPKEWNSGKAWEMQKSKGFSKDRSNKITVFVYNVMLSQVTTEVDNMRFKDSQVR